MYIPYLGKNYHPAYLTQVSVVDGSKRENAEKLDCLFPKHKAEIDSERNLFGGMKYEEALPIGLAEQTNQYQLQKFIYTNMILCHIEETVWDVDGKQVLFY